MFRSPTIIRELALNLAKVIFMLKHSVKLRRYLLCGCVAACYHITVLSTRRLAQCSQPFLDVGPPPLSLIYLCGPTPTPHSS